MTIAMLSSYPDVLDILKLREEGEHWGKKRTEIAGTWLGDRLSEMTDLFPISSFGTKAGVTAAFIRQQLDRQAIRLLSAFLDTEVFDFLGAAFDTLKPVLAPLMGTTIEPCDIHENKSRTAIVSPEWLRHMLSALYNKEGMLIEPNKDYFPFENRDHFVHPFLVASIGSVLLHTELDSDAMAAIRFEFRRRHWRQSTLDAGSKIIDVTAAIFRNKGCVIGHADMLDRIRRLWTRTALWHDVGYDFSLWCLITVRELSYCEAIKSVKVGEIIIDVCNKVASELRWQINDKKALSNALKAVRNNVKPYHMLWLLDGCRQRNARRCWGRTHAVFSAYEYLSRFGGDTDNDNKILSRFAAAAVAEHHEFDDCEVDDKQLAKRFARNPISELLRFTDVISGFHRVKVDFSRAEVRASLFSGEGRVSFSFEMNEKPLLISREGTRLTFRKGRKRAQEVIKAKSLWGSYVESGVMNEKEDCPGNCLLHPNVAEKRQ